MRRYWQLVLLRVLTGISVGGAFPLVFSLIGDLFSVKQRANVAAGVQVATGVGFAAGQAIAGFVGEAMQTPSSSCAMFSRSQGMSSVRQGAAEVQIAVGIGLLRGRSHTLMRPQS